MDNRAATQWPLIRQGNIKALAGAISSIENGLADYSHQLSSLPASDVPVIGITGPPGVGKSTLVDALIGYYTNDHKRVAVLCVDPSSTRYFGALLGDRIRMNGWYNHPGVYIRSLATRGALGGLNPRIIEITDMLKYAPFDVIIVETVGVGQNEIEIAGLADTSIVVLAPEAGDDIQSMKAGLLEIADLFVVNKSDRPGADHFVRHLRSMQSAEFQRDAKDVPIIKTVASEKQGIDELAMMIKQTLVKQQSTGKKYRQMAERAYLLIQQQRMSGISKTELAKQIEAWPTDKPFNLYQFVASMG